MISTTSDAVQQTLLQSFTPPASRAVAVSLSDKEAVLSADGKSKGDTIWISSDNDSDTEDEGDNEGPDLDDSQSCTTPTTSIAGHLDSMSTKHSPTELEEAIRTNRTSAGDAAACADASFNVSPTSPGSQPHRSVSDEQELVTGATSELDIIMVDALSDERSSDSAQSIPTSPLHAYSCIAASLGDVAHTPLHDSEDCESGDAGSESSEAKPRSSFGAQLSPPSPPSQELSPRRRSRRRSSHAHETVQDKDGDVDTEGSGSEDDLDSPECARDEGYCPSPNQGHGSGDDSDDGQHCRKRRKASGSPYSSVRSTPTSAQDSRRRKRSTRAVAHSLRERGTPALGLLSRASSHARSVPSDASAFLAQF
ncbi:hypothetical protein FNYG_08426 [Fusarium nygamai]|uniref:Uncharacterized protein n=1 Tax=Gibberella nygamai TaxID=42673 RepID=A0A2K0W7K9_GIBNY|nr:hypothetical protein FNYG_08426 [Fusarium nygamai]